MSLVYVLLKRKIKHFHIAVVQSRQRNVHKSVTHVQGCYCENLLLFDVLAAVAVVGS